jgi:hypothetical protein
VYVLTRSFFLSLCPSVIRPRCSQQLGTPCFGAPEQLDRRLSASFDPRASDTFSFGQVLWCLLMGRRFSNQEADWFSSDGICVDTDRLADTVLAPHAEAKDSVVMPELVRLYKRCVDRDPRKRPAMEQVRKSLREALVAFLRSKSGAVGGGGAAKAASAAANDAVLARELKKLDVQDILDEGSASIVTMPAAGVRDDWTFKVVLLGTAATGKSSIMERFVHDRFQSFSQSTIGAAFNRWRRTENGNTFQLEIWDTAGQERFRTHAAMVCLGRIGVDACFLFHPTLHSVRCLDIYLFDLFFDVMLPARSFAGGRSCLG